MMQGQVLEARHDVSGGYRVDVGRGERVGRVSSEWFSRPDDERYLSLDALTAAVRARSERSRTRVIESAAIEVQASRDNPERLTLLLPGAEAPVAPTHWSFGQLASMVGAPAAYLRQLPASLAGINLQYGLSTHRAEQIKTLETDNGRIDLRAVTGPDYGRIHDHELAEAVQRIAGNGTGDTRWKVPGVEASIQHVYLPSHAEGLNDSSAAQSISERHEGWEADLPGDDAALWDWIAALDSASRLALLAHCVSYGVNALHEKPNPYSASGVSEHGLQVRLAQADRLARAVALDIADAGWRPTVVNYLGRVTKAQILEAVREGAGEGRVKALEGLKKEDMAREAEQLLAGTGWLPEPLRVPGGVSEDGPDADQADIAADDDAETSSPEGDPDRIAAE